MGGCAICGGDHLPPTGEFAAPDAACPPCPCMWCRYRRGEASTEEANAIRARDRAIAAETARREARRLAEKIKARWKS